jgi:arabinogalactan endo-1,4-beta-galactosidase
MNELATTFQKPIMIVETSYAFTLGWNDWTNNVIGLESQLLPAYPATPEGQKAFFLKLVQMVENIPNKLGKGVVWWAPDMVAFNGPESTSGSSFENLCVFDFDNKVLPVMEVFKEK